MKSAGKGSPTTSRASALATLMRLHPLLPPRFPTLFELAETPLASPASSPRQGLFASLLGDPAVLFDDLLKNPGKYEPGVEALLLQLIGGRRRLQDLSIEEQELLDRATLDWNHKSSSAAPKTSPEKSSETEEQRSSSEDSVLSKTASETEPREEEIPSDLIPDEEMIPHWFR